MLAVCTCQVKHPQDNPRSQTTGRGMHGHMVGNQRERGYPPSSFKHSSHPPCSILGYICCLRLWQPSTTNTRQNIEVCDEQRVRVNDTPSSTPHNMLCTVCTHSAYKETLIELHNKHAMRLLHVCERNGGVYTKAAQFGSALQAIPPEYRTYDCCVGLCAVWD